MASPIIFFFVLDDVQNVFTSHKNVKHGKENKINFDRRLSVKINEREFNFLFISWIIHVWVCDFFFSFFQIPTLWNLHTSVQIAHFINLHQILSIIRLNNNMQISDPYAIFFSFQHKTETKWQHVIYEKNKPRNPFFCVTNILFENSFMHHFYIAWENPFKSNLIRKLSQFSIKKIPFRIKGILL